MDDFGADGTPTRVWTIWLVPRGLDVFTVQPDQLRQVVAEARNALEATSHPDVRRLAGSHYPVDAQPGTVSAIVRGIAARARAAADRAERDAWERGETSDLVRAVVGSRPLGGGW